MSVRIRLKRVGRKNRPAWRICVFDSRTRRDGRTIDDIGFYDTLAPETAGDKFLRVDIDRAKHWLAVGAQPTDIVRELFKRAGVHAKATA